MPKKVTLYEVFDDELVAQVARQFNCSFEEARLKIWEIRHPYELPPGEEYW